jgi:hypothetical protein
MQVCARIKEQPMKFRRLFFVLVVLNLVCLAFQFAKGGAGQAEPVASVIRAKSFELVDDQGRVRAQLKVFPAQPSAKMPDGTTGYPETVLLRLINSKGAPNVKLAATEDGTACSFVGEGKGYVQIISRGKEEPSIKVVTKDGRERELK